jgi:glutamate-1-semialdehyde 2,1-aminomutase
MGSRDLFERAQRVIPGGVNSPVRAFNAVGGTPVYMARGTGSRLQTADGRELVDFCCSWGPLILGHAHPAVVEAIARAAEAGTSFGANTEREVAFAETLCECVPYLEQVRIMSSGTEATMTALRLARGVTGRRRILKFDGCYHGHTDYLLVAAGSGLLTGGTASSAGVSPAAAEEVLLSPYNDIESVDRIVAEHGTELAAIVVEPIAGNMGLVKPPVAFLEGVRAAADRCGALLVFDEVITGFRLGPTTYGAISGVTPDLTCLGKIIGGGMPIGGVGGRRDVMESLAPLGEVYQAGTLSGNPVAVAAGQATLDLLQSENPYPELKRLGRALAGGFNALAAEHGVAAHMAQEGSMTTPFFRSGPVENLADAKGCDTEVHARFFHAQLKGGCYLPPSQFEVAFVSAAHRDDDVARFLDVTSTFFQKLP